MGINLIDILMACIIGGCLYIGRKSDFFSELFKLLGVYFATIIAVHYYVPVGRFVADKWLVPDLIQNVFAFGLLAASMVTLFYFVREGWIVLLKIEGLSFLDQWGRWVLTVIRIYLICGLIFLAILITGNRAITRQARGSLSSNLFQYVSIRLYKGFFTGFVHKLLSDEPMNEKALELVPDDERLPKIKPNEAKREK